MPLLCIERVDVTETRIEAVVRVTDPRFMRTSSVQGLAERALRVLPGLARHRCDNVARRDIRAELADTETPHLLEHIATELMALSGSPRSLRAETVWDFARDGNGVFRVSLAYDNDLVALGSLKEASSIVGWLLGGINGCPDIDGAIERLRAVRKLP